MLACILQAGVPKQDARACPGVANRMADFFPAVPDFDCFPEYENAPEIIPGRSEREWMDATTQRFAYRCTPLPIANSSGWEVILPASFAASWNGGLLPADVTFQSSDDDNRLKKVVESVFGHGILTFHPGYLFRTSPGWAILARGAPNTVKDGIVPLEGLVETDWLPFPFTMNWRFTRPGTVRFEEGEGFCFLQIVPHAIVDEIEPRVRRFADEPKLRVAYEAWRKERSEFQARVARRDPEAVKLAWQRDYVNGRDPSGLSEPVFHLSKRHLKKPK
jgi:uncharacterized protein DUF6065